MLPALPAGTSCRHQLPRTGFGASIVVARRWDLYGFGLTLN